MTHQIKPKSFGSRLGRKSNSIINNGKTKFGASHCKSNIDLLGGGMFDRVCHSLLRNLKELVRNGGIMDTN